MYAMEEGVGSAEPSAGMVKKKTSSGCLLIKKKGDGSSGFGASSSKKKGIELSKKKKKRPRLILSDSESSDELESPPQTKTAPKIDKIANGSVSRKAGFSKSNSLSKTPDLESDRKRSGLDVFEFDEYDHDGYYDVKKTRKDDTVGRSGNKREQSIGSGSRNVMVEKKRPDCVDSKSSISGKSSKNIFPKKNEEEEDRLTISSLTEKDREACDEPIRLKGENSVLKVMVNKQKKKDIDYNHQESEGKKGSRSEHVAKTSAKVRPSSHSDSKLTDKRVSFVKTQKRELKSQKAVEIKNNKVKDSEKKLESSRIKAYGSIKTVKREGKTVPTTEKTVPVKKSASTEKQKLREKIKNMLLDAGWTIDYRPRRDRDYLDAVYINPNGSAYWSIVKAYDVFQKQLKEDKLDDIKKESLPEEILTKLTRQTQKKMERGEMQKRSREDSDDDKLSYYLKQNHKSIKRRTRAGDDKSTVRVNSRSRNTGRCTLLVRRSEADVNSEGNDDGFVPYMGKRTVLAWLIDTGTVRMSEKVEYMDKKKTRVMLEGWVTREGIHCSCCSKILNVSKFEIHAGSKQKQPYPNIFLESGLSLLQCQVEAWNKQEESKRMGFHRVDVDGDDPNDDTCGLCGDGGDLICCDGCPSTFHQSCLNVEMLPQGEWYCANCTCKFCGKGAGITAEANGTTVSLLLTCSLCEKKYHGSCSRENDDLPNSVSTTTFCGDSCRKLFVRLRKILGVKHELDEGYSWSIIHRVDPKSSSTSDTMNIQRVECNSKLAVALSIMDECFLPIVDRRSEIDLIQSVLYNCGSNFDRLNYSSFYTVILERGDEIVCAASIRIRGNRLAEMPFIGTRHMYRRKGMCRRLFGAIESVLRNLKVEKLMIPAIPEHMHTWTEAFNFKPLEEIHKQEMRSFNMLVFPGIDMLQKQLVNPDIPKENVTKTTDSEIAEMEENQPPLPVTEKDTALNSSNGTELRVPSEEIIADNASSESDADMKCPTPSDPNLVADRGDDTQEVSRETSSVGLIPDDTAEANKNQNLVSVSTVTFTKEKSSIESNPSLYSQSIVEVETESASAHSKSTKRDICEGTTEPNRSILDGVNPEGIDKRTNLSADLNNSGLPDMSCEAPLVSECGSEAEVAEDKVVHIETEASIHYTSDDTCTKEKSSIKSYPDMDNHGTVVSGTEPAPLDSSNTTEPNQSILDGVNHEGIEEGTQNLCSNLNNNSSHSTGFEVPFILECGSDAKIAEANVLQVEHIQTEVSSDETVEKNQVLAVEVKNVSAVEMGNGTHVITGASSNGVH